MRQKEFMNPGNGLNEKSVRERLRPRDAELERVEAGLARARALIREGTTNWSSISAPVGADYVPQGDIYRNATAFHRYTSDLLCPCIDHPSYQFSKSRINYFNS